MAFLNSSLNAPKRYQSLTISAYLFMHSKTSLPLPSQSAEPNISPRKPFLFRPFLLGTEEAVRKQFNRAMEKLCKLTVTEEFKELEEYR